MVARVALPPTVLGPEPALNVHVRPVHMLRGASYPFDEHTTRLRRRRKAPIAARLQGDPGQAWAALGQARERGIPLLEDLWRQNAPLLAGTAGHAKAAV